MSDLSGPPKQIIAVAPLAACEDSPLTNMMQVILLAYRIGVITISERQHIALRDDNASR